MSPCSGPVTMGTTTVPARAGERDERIPDQPPSACSSGSLPSQITRPAKHPVSMDNSTTYLSRRVNTFPVPEYLKLISQQPLYDPETNPEGVIRFGVAENKLLASRFQHRLEQCRVKVSCGTHFSYGHTDGTPQLKDAMARVLLDHVFVESDEDEDVPHVAALPDGDKDNPNPTTIPHENLFISNGLASSMQILALTVADCATDRAPDGRTDAIMYFSPRYPGFVFDFGGQAGVKCVELPLRTPGMLPTAAELDRFLEEQTKAGVAVRMCVLCHPDNPTGYVWTRAECLRLVAWCRQNEVLLVSDEIYAKSPQWAAATTTPTREDRRDSTVVLVIDDPAPGAPSSGSTAKSGSVVPERFQSLWRYADVTLWGLSKDIGLAGLRCGVMYSPHASLFRKARTYAEPMQLPAIYQTVLAEVLADKGFIDKYLADLCQELQLARQAVRKKLVDELRLSIDLPEVGKRADGGVFVWVDFSEFGIPSADLFSILLEEYRVFLAPGHSFFDAPALGDACYHLRLCFAGCSPDTLAVGLERVARFVRDARDGKFAPRTPSTTGSIE